MCLLDFVDVQLFGGHNYSGKVTLEHGSNGNVDRDAESDEIEIPLLNY